MLALVGGTVGAALFVRAMNRTRLDPALVAVAPLAVGAADLDSAGTAIAASVVARLRGAAVRPVSAAEALRAWDSHAAPAAAAVLLAQRTGAGLVVLAQLWPQGGRTDSVRLVARLLDVSNNTVRARFEMRAWRGQATSLGDSLAGLLLRELARD